MLSLGEKKKTKKPPNPQKTPRPCLQEQPNSLAGLLSCCQQCMSPVAAWARGDCWLCRCPTLSPGLLPSWHTPVAQLTSHSKEQTELFLHCPSGLQGTGYLVQIPNPMNLQQVTKVNPPALTVEKGLKRGSCYHVQQDSNLFHF